MKPLLLDLIVFYRAAMGAILSSGLYAGVGAAAEIPATFDYRVLGWSDDSTRWGFQERGDYGSGMVFSPGGGVYVIDAAANRFVFEHFVGTRDSALDRGEAAVQQAADTAASRNLQKAKSLGLRGMSGTVVYKRPKMVWVNYDSAFKQFGDTRITFEHAGHGYAVKLLADVLPDPDSMVGTKSKFSIAIRRDDDVWQTLQADRRQWRPYLAYSIVHASISPDGRKIAILVEVIQNGVEGQKQAFYKGITGLLP